MAKKISEKKAKNLSKTNLFGHLSEFGAVGTDREKTLLYLKSGCYILEKEELEFSNNGLFVRPKDSELLEELTKATEELEDGEY